MALDLAMVTQKAGPLPVWAWGAIGGGTLLVVSKLRGAGAPSAASNPLNLPLPGNPANPGGTTTNGTDPGATAPPSGAPDLGALSSFISGLPNAPNDFTYAVPGGALLNFSNGVPTFGNGAGLTSGMQIQGQNDLALANANGYWANILAATNGQTADYAAYQQAYAETFPYYQQAYTTNLENYYKSPGYGQAPPTSTWPGGVQNWIPPVNGGGGTGYVGPPTTGGGGPRLLGPPVKGGGFNFIGPATTGVGGPGGPVSTIGLFLQKTVGELRSTIGGAAGVYHRPYSGLAPHGAPTDSNGDGSIVAHGLSVVTAPFAPGLARIADRYTVSTPPRPALAS